jgi:hypothetical protein
MAADMLTCLPTLSYMNIPLKYNMISTSLLFCCDYSHQDDAGIPKSVQEASRATGGHIPHRGNIGTPCTNGSRMYRNQYLPLNTCSIDGGEGTQSY